MRPFHSVDPGNGHPCVASWDDTGLISCGEWDWAYVTNRTDDDLVIENQVIIPRFTKNPASIVKLCQWSGACARAFGWPADTTRVRWVMPRAWKGGTKKPTSAKAWATYVIHRLVYNALSPEERVVYDTALLTMPNGQRHDLADAVGIGLWHLGRLR